MTNYLVLKTDPETGLFEFIDSAKAASAKDAIRAVAVGLEQKAAGEYVAVPERSFTKLKVQAQQQTVLKVG